MPVRIYRNLDLLVESSPQGYRARVVSSPGGEGSCLLSLPFSAEEMAQLAQPGVTGLRRHLAPAPAATSHFEPKTFGTRLFDSVFRQDVGTCLRTSLAIAEQKGEGLRIRLRLQEAGELADLPWEYLFDSSTQGYLALSDRTPVVRYVELTQSNLRAEAFLVQGPLRILAVLAEPRDVEQLDVKQEWEKLQTAMADLQARGLVVIEQLQPPSRSALQQRLARPGNPVHILHCIGHGHYDAAKQRGYLVFEDESGASDLVDAETLEVVLHDHESLRLVFLNACETGRSSQGDPFAGVAPALVRAGVPAVIAMQVAVTDSAAVDLSAAFFAALMAGQPVDAALAEARKTIYARHVPPGEVAALEWGTPVLFMRAPDGALFDLRDLKPTPPCPYPGMVPFREDDAALFFGRKAEIDAAVDALRLSPFLAVIGPSGSGKSSLVFAGIVPRLRNSSFFGRGGWQVVSMRPGDQPSTTLAGKLQLQPDDLLSANGRLPDMPGSQHLLLVVDQFEELFTTSTPDEVLQFTAVLQRLIAAEAAGANGRSPRLYIILTVRADFYADLFASPLWPQVKDHRLEITLLKGVALREAIVQPAQEAGVTLQPALVERLLADAGDEPGVLPFVQETLVILWERVRRLELGLNAYTDLVGDQSGRSGLQIAMARQADSVYQRLAPSGQRLARRILLRLIQFGEGRADTRRQQTLEALQASDDEPALFVATVENLANSRLLTLADQQRHVDIAHEALIAGWPMLRAWIAERREAEQIRRRLEGKAQEWQRLRSGAAGLLDEVELREAESWLAGTDAEELGYSPLLAALATASREAADEARRREEAARQHELVQAQALAEEQRLRAEDSITAASRLRMRAYLATAIGLIALVAAVVAVWFGYQSDLNYRHAQDNEQTAVAERATAQAASTLAVERQATAQAASALARQREQQAIEGYSRQLAAQADSLISTRLDLALLLAVEAGHRARTAEARQSLLGVVTVNPALLTFLQASGSTITTAKIAPPPGKLAATAGDEDGTISLWDLEGRKRDSKLLGHTSKVFSAAWSPDGRMLASGDIDGHVVLWQIGEGDIVSQTLGQQVDAVRAIAFSPDGRFLAAGGCYTPGTTGRRRCEVGEVEVWPLQPSLASSVVLTGHVDSVYDLAFSADGSQLATAGCAEYDDETGSCPQGEILVWSVTDGWPQVRSLPAHAGLVLSLAFHPLIPQVLASGSQDGGLRVWDTETGDLLFEHQEANNLISGLAFTQDGQKLVSTQCGRLNFSAFTPECLQGDLRLWSFDLGSPSLLALLNILTGHTNWVTATSFAPDSQTLLSGGGDGKLVLWDVQAWSQLADAVWYRDDPVTAVAYGPDSTRLAISTCGEYSDGINARCISSSLQLLRTDTAQVETVLESPQAGVDVLAFSPVQKPEVLAAGGCELVDDEDNCVRGRVTLWDVDAGSSSEAQLTGHASAVNALAFSPDGASLASGDESGEVIVWDMGTRRPLFAPLLAGNARINSVSFSADKELLATADGNGIIRLWDAATGESLRELASPGSAGGATARFAPGQNPDLLASGGAFNHPVTLWEPVVRSSQVTIPRQRLSDSGARVLDLAFSADGSLLASVDSQGQLVLWDAVRRQAVGPALSTQPLPLVTDLDLRPDGRQVATAIDNVVWAWDVDPASWERRACRRANRENLTSAEWERYFGSETEHAICSPPAP